MDYLEYLTDVFNKEINSLNKEDKNCLKQQNSLDEQIQKNSEKFAKKLEKNNNEFIKLCNTYLALPAVKQVLNEVPLQTFIWDKLEKHVGSDVGQVQKGIENLTLQFSNWEIQMSLLSLLSKKVRTPADKITFNNFVDKVDEYMKTCMKYFIEHDIAEYKKVFEEQEKNSAKGKNILNKVYNKIVTDLKNSYQFSNFSSFFDKNDIKNENLPHEIQNLINYLENIIDDDYVDCK